MIKRFLKTSLLWLLAAFYVIAGANHFLSRNFYLRMMPPYIPWHDALVAISGVTEIALGLLVLFPRTRRMAGWGIMALLIAVFPANLYMYQHPGLFPNVPPRTLLIRLPVQALLMAWAWWVTREHEHI